MDKVRKSELEIAQNEHDPNVNAKKVKIVDTELAINIDAEDGDSAAMRAMYKVLKVTAGEAFSVAGYPTLAVYGPSCNIEVTPFEDVETWFTLGAATDIRPINVCAVRAKIDQDCTVVLMGY